MADPIRNTPRTSTTSDVSSAPPPAPPARPGVEHDRVEVADDRPAWLVRLEEIAGHQPAPAPRMTVRDRVNVQTGMAVGLSFDRPVTRDEAARQLFSDGKLPRHPGGLNDNQHSMILRPRDGKEPSTQWELYLPNTAHGWPYKTMKPGVEDAVLDPKVPARMPAWIPATSARMIESGQVPPPAGTRGLDVKTHGSVTTWRDGDALFRYDARSGQLEGMRLLRGEGADVYNKAMLDYVHGEGKSLDQADAAIAKEFSHINWSFISPYMDRYQP